MLHKLICVESKQPKFKLHTFSKRDMEIQMLKEKIMRLLQIVSNLLNQT